MNLGEIVKLLEKVDRIEFREPIGRFVCRVVAYKVNNIIRIDIKDMTTLISPERDSTNIKHKRRGK